MPQQDASCGFIDILASGATGAHEAFSQIAFPNSLRLELLSRHGLCRQLLGECVDFNLYMAERTGTLWENVHAGASCNHGFASHAVHVLYRDVLGIYRHDPVGKSVTLRFCDLPLDWCEGRVPVPGGAVPVRWWKDARRICYRVSVPAGYTVNVENRSGKALAQQP